MYDLRRQGKGRDAVRMRWGVLLLLSASLWAESPVARVQSIESTQPGGQALLQRRHEKEAQPYRVTVNATGYVRDHFVTNKNTVAALEFLIGGRVGLNKDSDIQIVDDHSIKDGKTSVTRIILKSGAMWVKADAASLKQPLEIQTNGGVMGIKGTEFSIETTAEGADVCCFESNSEQGGVEILDDQGKVLGTVRPGDEMRSNRRQARLLKSYANRAQFREQRTRRIFGALGPRLQRWMLRQRKYGHSLSSTPLASPRRPFLDHEGMAEAWKKLIRNPHQAGQRLARSRAGKKIARRLLNQQGNDFPTDLLPDLEANPQAAASRPQFSWDPVEGADGYLLFLARDEEGSDILYTARTSNPNHGFPEDVRPLEAGRYYWRVVPVDGEDRPVQKSSQAAFDVAP